MTSPLILGTNSIKDEGYNVANSLRFNDDSSDSLSRTMGTPTNGKKFTISVWCKFSGESSGAQEIIAGGTDGSNETFLRYTSNETIQFRHDHSSDTNWQVQTSRKFRDPSAWYHIVAQVDTTHANQTFRIRLYVNGVQETDLSVANYPALNEETFLNKASATVKIGQQNYTSSGFFDGYMTEFVFLDGLDHGASFFGEFDDDTGIWKPKDVSGFNFGTNGFYLDFENSSSLGADVSGNGNNFTVNNLTSIDQTTDTCTNNFATMNPLDNYYANSSFSEGNLKVVTGSSEYASNTSTFGINTGKWYVEVKATNIFNGYSQLGIKGRNSISTARGVAIDSDGYAYVANGGQKGNNGSYSSYGTVWNSNDIIGIAVDLDNNYIYFSRNGTWQNSGDPESGSSGTGSAFSLGTPSSGFYYFACSDNDSGASNTFEFNFGNPPFTISSGNSDGNGYGNFEYSVPSGYYALNTKNLAEYG